MTTSADQRGLGRELIGGGASLAVARYRDRVMGRMDLSAGKGKTVLDLGCGDGMEAEYLALRGWKVLALDLVDHPAWKPLAKKWKGRLKFATCDAAKLSKKAPGTYDLVFEKDVLHHVPDPDVVLSQMKKKVKRGGRLAVLECNRHNPIFYLHLTLLGDHQHFTRRQLAALMDKAGLAGWELSLIEARVWPVESKRVQDWMERLQDLVERMAPLRPWLCYHLAQWSRSK